LSNVTEKRSVTKKRTSETAQLDCAEGKLTYELESKDTPSRKIVTLQNAVNFAGFCTLRGYLEIKSLFEEICTFLHSNGYPAESKIVRANERGF